jgi:hypothetical protein
VLVLQGGFNLTNLQDGLLATAFMVGLLIASPIFSESCKHYNAFRLIGIGMGTWTLATLGCGLSVGFYSLIICRMFVGVGEASFVALAAPFIGARSRSPLTSSICSNLTLSSKFHSLELRCLTAANGDHLQASAAAHGLLLAVARTEHELYMMTSSCVVCHVLPPPLPHHARHRGGATWLLTSPLQQVLQAASPQQQPAQALQLRRPYHSGLTSCSSCQRQQHQLPNAQPSTYPACPPPARHLHLHPTSASDTTHACTHAHARLPPTPPHPHTPADDYAPPGRKARWLSLFYLCIPVGFACGYIYGGLVASALHWRAAFIIEAALMVPFVLFSFLAEPVHLQGGESCGQQHRVREWRQVVAEFAADVQQVRSQGQGGKVAGHCCARVLCHVCCAMCAVPCVGDCCVGVPLGGTHSAAAHAAMSHADMLVVPASRCSQAGV